MSEEERKNEIRIACDKICAQAGHDINLHNNAAKKYERAKNFHSLTVSLISIFNGSVLFFVLQNISSDILTLTGSVLGFVAASCAAINAHFKYPEKEVEHRIAVKRLRLFIFRCEQIIRTTVTVEQLESIYQERVKDYEDIIKSSPTILD